MFKKFISKVVEIMEEDKRKSLEEYGSTNAIEQIFVDANNKFFKGRYLGRMVFMDVIRYKYEVNGGFLLLDKPAIEHGGIKGVSNTAVTYNNRSQLQRLNVSTGIANI